MGQLQERYKSYREPQKFMAKGVYPYFRIHSGQKNGNKDSPAGDNGSAHLPESKDREGRLGLVQAVLGLIYGYMQELLPGAGKVLHR